MHPLAPDLSGLNETDLHQKYNEINQRILHAFSSGNQAMLNQLQMLAENYKQEIDKRNAKHMEELQAKLEKNKQKQSSNPKKQGFSIIK